MRPVAAGVVMGAIDFVVNGIVLAERNEAALNALNPDLAANLEGGSFVAFGVVALLLWGILIAWTYASMRPRYGEGPKTAVMAALQLWAIIMLISAGLAFTGMFTWSFIALGGVITAACSILQIVDLNVVSETLRNCVRGIPIASRLQSAQETPCMASQTFRLES